MSNSARRTRRLLGLAFLAAAFLMLFAGQTVLRGSLEGITFIVYWLACLGLVTLALLTALLDALIIRQQTRRQQLDLLRDAFSVSTPVSTVNPLAHDPEASQPRTRAEPGANS
jgi:hypothetical protein